MTAMCFVHPDREATLTMRVPCAPNGLLFVCDHCYGPGRKAAFDAYFKIHHELVERKRAKEVIQKIGDN